LSAWVTLSVAPVYRLWPPDSLEKLGGRMVHHVQIVNKGRSFGRGEIIVRLPNRILTGGTEPRTDGLIAPWSARG